MQKVNTKDDLELINKVVSFQGFGASYKIAYSLVWDLGVIGDLGCKWVVGVAWVLSAEGRVPRHLVVKGQWDALSILRVEGEGGQ
jgi:hypothetical protein